MRILLLVALAVGLCPGCASMGGGKSAPAPAAVTDTVSVEYEIYSAILATWDVTGKSSIVLDGETADAMDPADFDDRVFKLKETLMQESPSISLSKGLLESYRVKMGRKLLLDPSRLGASDVRMVSPDEMQSFFGGSGDGWKGFRDRFGQQASIVTFSRVGFSPDGSRALLTLSRSCGKLCGTGSFILLESSEGAWRVIARVSSWSA